MEHSERQQPVVTAAAVVAAAALLAAAAATACIVVVVEPLNTWHHLAMHCQTAWQCWFSPDLAAAAADMSSSLRPRRTRRQLRQGLAAGGQAAAVAEYVSAAMNKSERERSELQKDKTGVFTGERLVTVRAITHSLRTSPHTCTSSPPRGRSASWPDLACVLTLRSRPICHAPQPSLQPFPVASVSVCVA
eukprot:GHRQ01034650.1.p1 GENE.GHRQ01034650.1~~GHRQ01034650.1.p1  ORF type:complete len:190 (+),score=17.69 GHRQ01034650.1:104-673(+)